MTMAFVGLYLGKLVRIYVYFYNVEFDPGSG